ncbi:hypothetical protein M2427_006297 [Bradyrhizobium sp. BR13661]|jgi:hypothetical protein|nr:hypothetical protein [Bradyrhizobium sp. BR13661]
MARYAARTGLSDLHPKHDGDRRKRSEVTP